MKTKETNWAQMLESLRKKSPKGFTTDEFADELDISIGNARVKLSKLVRKGMVACVGRRAITRMDGMAGVVPVYSRTNRA